MTADLAVNARWAAIVHWIQHTYNRRRRQRGFGRLTPVEFELAFTFNTAQAVA